MTIIGLCVAGARVLDVCAAGDEFMEARLKTIFNKKGKDKKVIEKGISFPVCLSVNECVCHFSPLISDAVVFIYS